MQDFEDVHRAARKVIDYVFPEDSDSSRIPVAESDTEIEVMRLYAVDTCLRGARLAAYLTALSDGYDRSFATNAAEAVVGCIRQVLSELCEPGPSG